MHEFGVYFWNSNTHYNGIDCMPWSYT